jgi:hypothetical protein
MSLLFMDGFDHYATADFDDKWDGDQGSPDIVSDPVRNGTRSGRVGYGEFIYKSWAFTRFVVVGVAFQWSGTHLTSTGTVFSLCDSSGTFIASLVYKTDYTFELRTHDNGGAVQYVITTSGRRHCRDVWHYFEVKIDAPLADASPDHAELRIDGELVGLMSLRGLFGIDSETGYKYAPQISRLYLGGAAVNTYAHYDDLYILDDLGAANNDFLGDCKVLMALPDGDGTHSEWAPQGAGANYVEVDDTTPDGATTYVYDDVVGQRDTYDFTNLSAESGTVAGVGVNVYAKKTDSGTREIVPMTISGVTEDVHADEYNLVEDVYKIEQRIWEEDPDAVAAWTITTINAAEFGVKVIT